MVIRAASGDGGAKAVALPALEALLPLLLQFSYPVGGAISVVHVRVRHQNSCTGDAAMQKMYLSKLDRSALKLAS